MRCYHLEYCTGGDLRQSGVQMLSNKDISDKTVLEGVSVLHSLVFDHEECKSLDVAVTLNVVPR